jgi:adenylosuccinate lyase
MIKRYSRPEMNKLWESENKFKKWLDIEILAVEAWAKLGVIPESAVKNIKEKAQFDINRIDEIEKETKHDVIAFLTCVSEYVGKDARYIHYGMTSSDVLDTSFSLILRDAGKLLLQGLIELKDVFAAQAKKYKGVPMIGRSHGVHAEPMTFG